MKYIALFIILISSSAAIAQEDSSIGIVTAVQGLVTVTDSSGTFDAVEGTPVKLGDTIETGEEAGVKILFDDDSLFSLGDNTSVVLNEFIYTPQERKSISNITKGKMRAIINLKNLLQSMVSWSTRCNSHSSKSTQNLTQDFWIRFG